MKQKDKVLNLFGFLMDLIEEPQGSNDEVKDSSQPPHPIFNPYISPTSHDSESNNWSVKHGLDLIKKMEQVDKDHASTIEKNRAVKKAVKKAVKPLTDELDKIKANALKGFEVDKKREEVEDILEKVGHKAGVTLEDGTFKLVEVPSKLRDRMMGEIKDEGAKDEGAKDEGAKDEGAKDEGAKDEGAKDEESNEMANARANARALEELWRTKQNESDMRKNNEDKK